MDTKELKQKFEYNYPFIAKSIIEQTGLGGYTSMMAFFLKTLQTEQDSVEPEVSDDFGESLMRKIAEYEGHFAKSVSMNAMFDKLFFQMQIKLLKEIERTYKICKVSQNAR